jgi:hypothetical protein
VRRAAFVGVVATLAACRASHPCGEVVTDRRSITGEVVYTPGSTRTPLAMTRATLWSIGRSTLEIDIELGGGARAARLELEGLAVGTARELGGESVGRACMVLQTGAARTCLSLRGTVEVRRLAKECFHHESGVSVCADDLDVSIHAKTEDAGVALDVDLDIVEAQRWTDPDCRE